MPLISEQPIVLKQGTRLEPVYVEIRPQMPSITYMIGAFDGDTQVDSYSVTVSGQELLDTKTMWDAIGQLIEWDFMQRFPQFAQMKQVASEIPAAAKPAESPAAPAEEIQ